MRALTPALLASAAGFWAPGRAIVITRVDGTVLRLAEMMTTQTFGGNSFLPGSNLIVGSIPLALNEQETNVDFDVFSEDGGAIDPQDVMDGLYRGGTAEIYAINRFAPSDGLGLLFSGKIGAGQRKSHGRVTMQVIGPLGQAGLELGHKFSPTCRAILGDDQCRVDLDPFKVVGTVAATGSGHSLSITGFNYSDPMYDPRGGYFEVQTGRMEGFKFEFARPGFSAFLYLPVGGLFSAGDTLWIFPDCTYEPNDAGCVFYNNIINFVGEPYMFGAQSLTGGINSLGSTGPGSDLPAGAGPGDFGFIPLDVQDGTLDYAEDLNGEILVSDFVVPPMMDASGAAATETDIKQITFVLREHGYDPAYFFDARAVLYSSAGTFLGKTEIIHKNGRLITELVHHTHALTFEAPIRVAIGSTIKAGVYGITGGQTPGSHTLMCSVMIRANAGATHVTEEFGLSEINSPPATLPPAEPGNDDQSKLLGWIRSTPVTV